MKRLVRPCIGVVMALGLVTFTVGPAHAVRKSGSSALADYARARMADASGDVPVALAGYSAALRAAPGNEMLVSRVFRQAILQGDNAMALAAGGRLDAIGRLPPDGRFLLLADAIARRDYRRASVLADKIESEELFAFTVPVIRAWIKSDSRSGDPLAELAGRSADPAFASYYAEQRAMLMLAAGRDAEAVALIRELAPHAGPGGAIRLQLVAAAALAGRKDVDQALSMLAGADPALAAARARLAAGKPLVAPMRQATQGLADLLLRLAADVDRERVTPMALSLARAALIAAPDMTEARLLTAGLLATSNQPRLALALLEAVRADDLYTAAISTARIRLLVKAGDKDQALRLALAAASATDANEADWSRLADLYSDLDRYQESANAYARAIEIARQRGDRQEVPWSLFLLHGGALDQAGRWPEAKAALREAVRLGPDQPVALNYLGYAQLERRENLAEAENLIERAAALRPEDPAITDSLGWTYFIRGNHAKAIDTLERAVLGEPGEPTINEHLGDAYWTVGRRIEARYAWRAALVHAETAASARITTKIDWGLTPETAAP